MKKVSLLFGLILIGLFLFGCTEVVTAPLPNNPTWEELTYCESKTDCVIVPDSTCDNYSDCSAINMSYEEYWNNKIQEEVIDCNAPRTLEVKFCFPEVDCINNMCQNVPGINSNIYLEYNWLNDLAKSMLDENSSAFGGYDSIDKCFYNGTSVYVTHHNHCCDFTSDVYNKDGEIICYFGGLKGTNNCSDFELVDETCETIWATEVE
jgi:hypothetical protein